MNNHMLTSKMLDHFKVVGYSDFDIDKCLDKRKFTFGYVFLKAEGLVS